MNWELIGQVFLVCLSVFYIYFYIRQTETNRSKLYSLIKPIPLLIIALCLLSIGLYFINEHEENDNAKLPITSIELNTHKDKSSPTGIYIPKDLPDCHRELDNMINDDWKAYLAGKVENFSKEEKDKYEGCYDHMSMGLWIRNNWGLWKGSALAKYFNGMGIHHPDDMSAIILSSYRAKLRNEQYDLNTAIRLFQKYWAQVSKPPDFVDPETGGKIIIPKEAIKYFRDNVMTHVGVNEKTGETWCYQLDRGWYKPSSEEFEYITHGLSIETWVPQKNSGENN
jgi:hypothetical protein